MHPTRQRLSLLLAGVLLATGALFALSDDAAPEEAASAVPDEPRAPTFELPSYEMPPPAEDAEARVGCALEAGERLSYRVSLDVRMSVDGAGVAGLPTGAAPQQADQSTTLVLELEALEASQPGSSTLLASYRAIESTSVARPDQLASPFLVRLNDDCSLGGFARHADTHRAHARVQQSILHELDWRWGEGSAEGQNGIGRTLSTIARVDDEGGLLVQRRVRSYAELWDEDGSEVDVRRSLLSVRVGPGPWFEALTGVEDLQHGSRRSVASLQVVRTEPNAQALTDHSHAPSDYIWENLLPADVSIRTPRPITQADRVRQAAVAHLTMDEAVGRYLGRVESERGIQEIWPELTDYLEARPEQAAPLVHRIQDGEIPGEARAGVYMALSRTRTAEAKQVLLAVASDGQAPIIERTRAMFALIDRDDVGVEVAQRLDSQARIDGADDAATETLARESLLALGAMAGQQENEAVTTLALAAAQERLASASSAEQMRSAFGAIGNIGQASAVSIVEPYTRSADPAIREVAVHGVRRLHPQVSASMISHWLDHENHPLVERRIYQTLVFQCADHQAPPTADLAERALRTLERQPSSQITRKALIRLLGTYAEAAPDGDALAGDAREALVRQVRLELDEGTELYDVIAGFLSANELHRALGLQELSTREETDR